MRRSPRDEKIFKRGQNHALTEMCEDAVDRGAEPVAGVKLDYETVGKMLIVTASRAALKAVPPRAARSPKLYV